MTPVFKGRLNEGKLILEKATAFREYLASLGPVRVTLTVEKERQKRSNQQNKYLWGVVYKLIAEYTGADAEEIHVAMKFHFGKKRFIGNIVAPASTRMMDTIDMTEYIEKIRRWAAEELSINIPDPSDVCI